MSVYTQVCLTAHLSHSGDLKLIYRFQRPYSTASYRRATVVLQGLIEFTIAGAAVCNEVDIQVLSYCWKPKLQQVSSK